VSDTFPITSVPDDAEILGYPEWMGTKRKFWYRIGDGPRWLFKYNRPDHGEDWSERIAADVADRLGIPHVTVELATYQNRPGVAVLDAVPDGFRLVHGNELLVEFIDPHYPLRQNFKVRQHTLANAFHVLGQPFVQAPDHCVPPAGVAGAAGVFIGYLLLDALVTNTDRHHENWAILERIGPPGGQRTAVIAPSFDHASSLGRNELDEKRRLRLLARDRQYTVQTYVEKAPSRFYLSETDGAPLSPAEAFLSGARFFPEAVAGWLDRLQSLSAEALRAIGARVPPERISPTAREFAAEMLAYSREMLLERGR